MENTLFSLHRAVSENPENGTETEEFTRTLAIQSFWVESQGQAGSGKVGLAFCQGEDDKEPMLLAYMRDDDSNEPPPDVAAQMNSGERDYAELPGAFLLTMTAQLNYTLCIIAENEETIVLDSDALKTLLTYLQILYSEDNEADEEEDGNPVTYSAAAGTMRGGSIVEKPGSAGKVIGFLILAAAIVAVVYFMQT
ncbi:TPA: hypothetical protein RG728_001007 [Morganella morganii subsp. morganii]|uniref:Uncharacterized protein n=1 Tax=Morganella morganii TaxID=582 RepID=A0AAU8ZGM1_MORMO|nr:hypothetical protein [Morganella morganii]HDU8691941.1 hypothetical protein [Morganella morganii subsp. morganii]AWC92254.1 hypothetical protein AM380_00545 [Morganella morganii]EKW8486578.1 hypothetical protein [Morganella morganii]HAT3624327.1 hypothetical protein [Morganella morganii]HCU0877966.1 hypothetical protein [Morganella morganii]